MKVVVTPRGFAQYGGEALTLFHSLGITVDVNRTGEPYTYETLLEKAKEADGLIVGVDDINEHFIQACPRLKVICKFGVGIDNIAVDEASKRGIHIGCTLGTNTNAVAEHVLALMFADAKQLLPSVVDVKAGGWNKLTGVELSGKTLGIVGFGAIGQRLAEMVKGIGMKILVYDVMEITQEVSRRYGAQVTSLEKVLDESDFVSLHVPLTEETQDMISDEAFERMKITSRLINASRGGVVDESALLRALKEGKIYSAAFDVFSDEPPVENAELLELKNFMLTPHTASRTEESEERTCNEAARIVCNVLKDHQN